MTDKKEGRRIILPKRDVNSRVEVLSSGLSQSTDILLHDAKCIIANELAYYRQKVSRGVQLLPKETKAVRDYLDSLVRLQKEEREQARSADLSNMSDEELLQAVSQLTNANQLGNMIALNKSSGDNDPDKG